MAKILIVDDSAVEQRLAGGLLNALPGSELQYADNGRDALEQIAICPPDVVITDLMMPEMDGLGLVRAVRESYPQVPVILMTAYGNEAIAVEALRHGAVSYISKSRRADTMVQTVRQVIERSEAVRGRQRLDTYLNRIECCYVLENDPSLLKPLLDMVENTLASLGLAEGTELVRIGVALEEALLNALYHGNLSVKQTSYDQARRTGQVSRLARYHSKEAPYCNRRITFKMNVSKDGAQFVIRDEGSGCRAVVLNPAHDAAEVFETGRFRGMALMKHLMDDVRYNEDGNEVKLSMSSMRGRV
jgi:CheY-like chemotaxis protein/anti-sigma regulatory factor (Ser/Thr protein kinase)